MQPHGVVLDEIFELNLLLQRRKLRLQICQGGVNNADPVQMPLERAIYIAVNGPFWVEVANPEHPFMAIMISRSRGTCLIEVQVDGKIRECTRLPSIAFFGLTQVKGTTWVKIVNNICMTLMQCLSNHIKPRSFYPTLGKISKRRMLLYPPP